MILEELFIFIGSGKHQCKTKNTKTGTLTEMMIHVDLNAGAVY